MAMSYMSYIRRGCQWQHTICYTSFAKCKLRDPDIVLNVSLYLLLDRLLDRERDLLLLCFFFLQCNKMAGTVTLGYSYTQGCSTMHKHVYGSKDGYSKDYCTHSHSDMKQYQSTGKLSEVNWEKKREVLAYFLDLRSGVGERLSRSAFPGSLF